MKHPYNAACTCKRCLKESKRRIDQSNSDRANDPTRRTMHHATRRQNSKVSKESRRPVHGSQEWAETRGDDIDSPSGDY